MRHPGILTPAFLALGIALFPGVARAGTQAACTEYAAEAQRQLQRGRELGCPNLTFPVWSMDSDHHYRWCLTVPEADSAAGTKLREDALIDCQGLRPGYGTITGVVPMADAESSAGALLQMGICKAYAKNAVIQQSHNVDLGCGLQGPEWNSNAADHQNWCMRGENRLRAEGAQRSREQALAPCRGAAIEGGTHPGLLTGPSNDDPAVPQVVLLDPRRVPEGSLLAATVDQVTSPQPACDDLNAAFVSMLTDGAFKPQQDGSYAWQPGIQPTLTPQEASVSEFSDLNASILRSATAHRRLRTARLDEEFRFSPRTGLRLRAVTSALEPTLRPDRLAELSRLRTATPPPSDPESAVLATLAAIANLSPATTSRITKVCGLRSPQDDSASPESTLWENGVGFLLGRGFGEASGTIDLVYEACPGGRAQTCEDLRTSGQPLPPGLLRLEPISSSAWSDRLIAFRVPDLPIDLPLLRAEPRVHLRPTGGRPPVVSEPVTFNRELPHVLGIKTDSGFDPGGLLLNGWVHWSNEHAARHDIFWVWSQKISQGSGWVRTGCASCPRGTRLDATHIAAPGDHVYVYGEGFGDKPGEIFLTFSNPTTSAGGLAGVSRDIPVEYRVEDWHNDRIRMRIKSSAIPTDTPRRPYLVIVDQNGRWISGRYGLAFSPPMAIKVVSGRSWMQMGVGEDDSVIEALDSSSMIVSHPTGGCDSFLIFPLDTNERGRDRFFHNSRPQTGISVISAEFAQLDAGVSEGDFLAKWGAALGKKMLESGPVLGFLRYLAEMGLESGVRSLGGDNGAYYIYAQKNGYADSGDPGTEVEWENTCTGPYANQPVKYSARFVLSGPKHLLYP